MDKTIIQFDILTLLQEYVYKKTTLCDPLYVIDKANKKLSKKKQVRGESRQNGIENSQVLKSVKEIQVKKGIKKFSYNTFEIATVY